MKIEADEVNAAIGRAIRAKRLERGLTQQDIGDSLGLTYQMIQKMEKGTSRVFCGSLAVIAHQLETPISFFFGENAKSAAQAHETMVGFLALPYAPEFIEIYRELPNQERNIIMTVARTFVRK